MPTASTDLRHETARTEFAFAVIEAAICADSRADDVEWRRELMMALGVVRAGLAPNAVNEPEHRVCRHGARPVDDLCEICDAE